MNNSLKVVLVLAVVWTVRIQAQAQYVEYTDQQGPQSVFVNPDVKQRLAQNAVTLREHLLHRRAALLQWQSLPASELQPVTLRVQAVAKNRGGQRELRVRRFHYLGDCGYSHGGQDSGVDTPTTAQAVFASDLADSFLNQAALLGIPIDSLSIELHGRPDTEKTDRVYYPLNFLYTVYIDTPATDAELQKLTALAEANSPVVNFIKKAIELTHDIDLQPSPKSRKANTLAGLREYLQGKRQAQQASRQQAEKLRKQLKAGQELSRRERKEQTGPIVIQSGTVYAYPSLESGSSLTQSCYTASLSTSNWYSFTQNGTAFAFKVPASGTWIVSGGSSLYSVSKSNGTTIFDGYGATDATVSGGSSVSLSSYSGGNSGGGPGGGGGPGWH